MPCYCVSYFSYHQYRDTINTVTTKLSTGTAATMNTWYYLSGLRTLLQGRVRYGTYRAIPPIYTAGITGTGHFGNFGTSIPVPDTSVTSVRHQYRYLRYRHGRLYRSWYRYRYNMDTGTGHFGKFCKTYPGTGHVGMSGTASTRYHYIVTSK